MLIVSPAVNMPHQRVAFLLGMLLEEACPDDLVVFGTPVNVRFALRSALEPDVTVARLADAQGAPSRLTSRPLLVAEVLSPDSVLRDLNLKKAAYERFGILSYWVVDPDLDRPALRVFELGDDGAYAEVACVTGDETFRAARPFSVEITPGRLVTKLRRG
jgi:Uma2 family endonuclease